MKSIACGISLLAVWLSLAAFAQTPELLNYQGRISVNGVNHDGPGRFKFALVDAAGTRSFWSNGALRADGGEPPAYVEVPVSKGLYSIQLGDTSIDGMGWGIPATIFTNADVRLRVWFDDGTAGFRRLIPDQRIVPVGYAMNAAVASIANEASLALRISPNIDVEGLRLKIGENNTVSGVIASVAGGRLNFALGDFSSIAGGEGNRAIGKHSIVAGGFENSATGAGAFIGGGGTDGATPRPNVASGSASVIAGGVGNEASDEYTAIGGGILNHATDYGASVAGGGHNRASGSYSHIGGGASNEAAGDHSTIAGGLENKAAPLASVGGGQNNFATNRFATIAGGAANVASGPGATIGGGGYDGSSGSPNLASATAATVSGGHANAATNRAAVVGGGEFNRAHGVDSSVGGGIGNLAEGAGAVVAGGGHDGDRSWGNNATGNGATVSGGFDNLAVGLGAAIPGGAHNSAEGRHSFAAGFDAHARHHGSFVWSDESMAWGGNFSSTRDNQFVIRATGGIGLNTAFTPEAGGVSIGDNVFLIERDLLLRPNNFNNGMGWYGQGRAFKIGFEPDGPVVYGNSGGALGTIDGGNRVALSWTLNDVFVNARLNALNGMNLDGELTVRDDFVATKDILLGITRVDGLGLYWPGRPFSENTDFHGPVLYGLQGGALGIRGEENVTPVKWTASQVKIFAHEFEPTRATLKQLRIESGCTISGGAVIYTGDLAIEGGGLRVSNLGGFSSSTFDGNVAIAGGLEVIGLKLFVESHPADPNKQIAYVALEGPEAGTFIRGSGKLIDGEATIELPDHFRFVTADEGLSVQLTARGQFLQLYVAESSPAKIVVKEAQGKSGQFDYLVQGIRKGYENYQPVRARK